MENVIMIIGTVFLFVMGYAGMRLLVPSKKRKKGYKRIKKTDRNQR